MNMELDKSLHRFYEKSLPQSSLENTMLKAPCPFCLARGHKEPGTLVVFLNRENYFNGYFRCLKRCVPGGYAPHFARLAGLDPAAVPGHNPEHLPYDQGIQWPLTNINQDIRKFQASLTTKIRASFSELGVEDDVLQEMKIGFNGRYIVYPFFQENGAAYAAHCLAPEPGNSQTWYGDPAYSTGEFRLFNSADINHCEDGSLFLVEGEINLLCLRALGFAGIAVPTAIDLDHLHSQRFQHLQTIFLCVNNTPEAEAAASRFAARVGFKVRLLRWGPARPRGFQLADLARQDPKSFKGEVLQLINKSHAFSPFATPGREFDLFQENIQHQQSSSYQALQSHMAKFDQALGGIHGINIIGGAPKAGKSCLSMQLASQMALNKVPVIYYDFENGRQKILQRTLSRLSRLPVANFHHDLDEAETQRYVSGQQQLRQLLDYLRIVNDRAITPELMRRHVDFLRHETRHDDLVVVIDSLHKLPFKDFSERRTGIDAWLRELEAIRDEMQVAFLVISELNRQDGGRYDGTPHMGLFKGSGDIEYTADNALVFLPDWDAVNSPPPAKRVNSLWLVASREQSPGLVGKYRLDYPYWSFEEIAQN